MKESEILQEYSQEALIDAVHENWYDWIRLVADLPCQSFLETPEYSILYTHTNGKSDSGWCLRLNTSPEKCESAIDDVFTSFPEHGLPAAMMVTPISGPDDLGSRLEARRLTRFVGGSTMAADLLKLKQERPEPEGFSIRRITDDSEIELFREMHHESNPEGYGNIDSNVDSIKMLGYAPDCLIRSYLGYMNDEPVATSQMTFASGVVGLWSMVVQTQHRRKGLGTAMTLGTLKLAINEGYRFGVLWSTDMAINMYTRVGFRELFKAVSFMETGEHT